MSKPKWKLTVKITIYYLMYLIISRIKVDDVITQKGGQRKIKCSNDLPLFRKK